MRASPLLRGYLRISFSVGSSLVSLQSIVSIVSRRKLTCVGFVLSSSYSSSLWPPSEESSKARRSGGNVECPDSERGDQSSFITALNAAALGSAQAPSWGSECTLSGGREAAGGSGDSSRGSGNPTGGSGT